MEILKQSTAATIKMGPFLDDTDGKTAETGLTISQADIRLSKNGGAFAQTNNATGATHDENGYYGVPLDTTDTGTLGRLRVTVSESGALPVWTDFLIVPANVYDSIVLGTDYLQIDVEQVDGDGTAAANLNSACDNYSVTRGLSGTALPAAAANGAGGLPVSDAGGLDIDTLLGYLTGNVATAAKLLSYIQLLARSDAAIETDNSAELTEINADGGSGGGDYSAQSDSGEAVRDHIGDGTNLTEAGGDGDHLTEAGGDGDHLTEAGGDGDHFTAVPWNAAWDAEAQSEAADALAAFFTSSAQLVDDIWGEASALTLDYGTLMERNYEMTSNKMTVNESTGAVALRNIGDSTDIATGSVTSNSGTTTRDELSWA
ncbi:MAG: hypothetical protein PVG39_02025 [Desulfobacteraceae bacterium]|jgi:hypothetical protein